MRTLVLLALVGLALAVNEASFKDWMVRMGKTYASPEEYQYRYKIFCDNAAYIEKENAMGHSWTLGFNGLADLTVDEYRERYLVPAQNFSVQTVDAGAVQDTDWTNQGCVGAIKNQAQCGSCYSFSATASLEFCSCMARSKTYTALSEQQCVDCSLAYGNLGCSGGWQENCWKYYTAFGGEDTQATYPYTAVKGTCKASTANIGGKTTGYTMVTSGSEAALQASIVARVTSVAIDASGASFQLYTSGVYCPTSCSTSSLDHAVAAVGQKTASPQDYYIVRNSWGLTWGQKGYIWMCANQANHCGIATHANYPTGCS